MLKFYVFSDVHFDHVKCNRESFKLHLDQALNEKAAICVNGDFFCLMQGKYDRRASKSAIRPEHNADNYIDLVINEAADFLAPYASNILFFTEGNHETKVSETIGSDVLDRLIERINMMTRSQIVKISYMSYVQFALLRSKTSRVIYNIAFDHGHWGGIISKGSQSAMRYAAFFPNAHAFFSGHTHDSHIVPIPYFELNSSKRQVKINNKYACRTGTYKEEFENGSGWAVQTIGAPKFLGCIRGSLEVKQNQKSLCVYPNYTIIPVNF